MLANRINRDILRERLKNETFIRKTLSFYRYVHFENPQETRDQLYSSWSELNCFGRIYIAREGINAQMSVPEHQLESFLLHLESIPQLASMPIKYAIVDDGKSFYKLTIKVRPKIVADGLEEGSYDLGMVGKHLNAFEFHELSADPSNLVIDMRNHYESEIGRFENAVCPDADTFKEAIQVVLRDYSDLKDRKVLLYCTGGIRCEKASAFLVHHGFKDVSQLYGGIIEYAQQIKKAGMPSRFIGKNFVFDERLGETVDGQVIARCHQCGKPADTHTNCANNDCHLLFIQCSECAEKYAACCSSECRDLLQLPEESRLALRNERMKQYAGNKIFKSRISPHFSYDGLQNELKAVLHE